MSTEQRSASSDLVSLVSALLHQIAGTAVVECELRSGSRRVFLKRSPDCVPQQRDAGAGESAAIPLDWIPIPSPLTGIYYSAETPQAQPFVREGLSIGPGHVIGLIEAMKTYNRVEIDQSGIVRAVLVKNGAEVQAGQTLIYIEPLGVS